MVALVIPGRQRERFPCLRGEIKGERDLPHQVLQGERFLFRLHIPINLALLLGPRFVIHAEAPLLHRKYRGCRHIGDGPLGGLIGNTGDFRQYAHFLGAENKLPRLDALDTARMDAMISRRVLRHHRRPRGVIGIGGGVAAVEFLFQVETQRLGVDLSRLLGGVDGFAIGGNGIEHILRTLHAAFYFERCHASIQKLGNARQPHHVLKA